MQPPWSGLLRIWSMPKLMGSAWPGWRWCGPRCSMLAPDPGPTGGGGLGGGTLCAWLGDSARRRGGGSGSWLRGDLEAKCAEGLKWGGEGKERGGAVVVPSPAAPSPLRLLGRC